VNIIETHIPDVQILEPRVFHDTRGFFLESWSARTFASLGLAHSFVQDNHSRSAKGVLRGLHYQIGRAQGKLVRVSRGAIYDVAVDLRRNSSNFGRWVGVELSDDNMRMLWVPPGFAHGFLTLRDGTDLMYKCTEFYAAPEERTILWNDPALAIDWPLAPGEVPQLSAKDVEGVAFSQAEYFA
jgi:dTDP-4-dehydrorhamnose 3,5-epimerase